MVSKNYLNPEYSKPTTQAWDRIQMSIFPTHSLHIEISFKQWNKRGLKICIFSLPLNCFFLRTHFFLPLPIDWFSKGKLIKNTLTLIWISIWIHTITDFHTYWISNCMMMQMKSNMKNVPKILWDNLNFC